MKNVSINNNEFDSNKIIAGKYFGLMDVRPEIKSLINLIHSKHPEDEELIKKTVQVLDNCERELNLSVNQVRKSWEKVAFYALGVGFILPIAFIFISRLI